MPRMSGGRDRFATGLCLLLLVFAPQAQAKHADGGAPVLVSPPVLSTSTAAFGTPISTTTGSWSSPVPISFTFAWQSCSATGDNCKDIRPLYNGDASKQTYIPAPDFPAGDTIRAAVTAWSIYGITTAYTAVTAPLPPAPQPPWPPPPPTPPWVNPLQLTASVSTTHVLAGSTFAFTTVVSYVGVENLSGATVGVGPLDYMQAVSATTSTGSCDLGSSGAFACRLDSLEFGKPATVTVVIRALKTGTFRLNSFARLGVHSGTSPALSVDVSAPSADVAVLASTVLRARTGRAVTAVIRIVNVGPDTALPVLQLEMSPGVEIVNASPYVGCVFGRCRLTQLDAGGSIVVALKLTAARSGTLTARLELANSFAIDPVSANDIATTRIVVRRAH
jgi:hypothetical protein